MKAHDAFEAYAAAIAQTSGRIAYTDKMMGDIIKDIANRINQDPDIDAMGNPLKRTDVVIMGGEKNEVYELKPASCESGYKHKKAIDQITGYIDSIINSIFHNTAEGDSIPENDTLPFVDSGLGDNSTITFWRDKEHSGLYYYSIDDGISGDKND